MAPRSKTPRVAPRLPQGLIDELERRHAGMARHMARAVVTLVHWDTSTGVPPQREAIVKACAAGLDLFLATAKEAPMRPNKLMLAGLIVTLVGIFTVIKHEMGLPSYWTPLLVGVGLLIAGAIWSMISRKSKIS